jgi:hypothetical protein
LAFRTKNEGDAVALKYRGDRTGSYDRGRGTGLVGKVVGPDARGHFRVITGAIYDEASDITTCDSEALVDPAAVLAKIEESIA